MFAVSDPNTHFWVIDGTSGETIRVLTLSNPNLKAVYSPTFKNTGVYIALTDGSSNSYLVHLVDPATNLNI